MNNHNANSIRYRGKTGDTLPAAARRMNRKISAMKFQEVTINQKFTVTEGTTRHDSTTAKENDRQHPF